MLRPSSPRNVTGDGDVLKIGDGNVPKASAREGSISLPYPMLTRSNYTTWAMKMKVFMCTQGVWNAIVDEEVSERQDQMALAAIFLAVPKDMLMLLAEKETAKETWNTLNMMHLGADRVREARVQNLKSEFDNLHMRDTEQIDDFTMGLMTIVSKIRGLGDKMEEVYIVRKFLRAVSRKFSPIASTIEQFGDIKNMSIKELIERLKTHEEGERRYSNSDGDDEHLLLTRTEWEARSSKHEGEGLSGGSSGGSGCWYRRVDKAKVRCFNCNDYRHFASECRKPNKREKAEAYLIEADADDEPALL
uniref:PH01B001E05.5 protein n=1 Tax=Phyllostachys edulis TaxID=38705 RepID=L0P1U6_PHYED|nr:PH01B001E05.5 [Phyllostachys edulis]